MKKRYVLLDREKAAIAQYCKGELTVRDFVQQLGAKHPTQAYITISTLFCNLVQNKKINIEKLLKDC